MDFPCPEVHPPVAAKLITVRVVAMKLERNALNVKGHDLTTGEFIRGLTRCDSTVDEGSTKKEAGSSSGLLAISS